VASTNRGQLRAPQPRLFPQTALEFEQLPGGSGQPVVLWVDFTRKKSELRVEDDLNDRDELLLNRRERWTHDIPSELAIRELQEVDLNDRDAICAFLREFGMVIPQRESVSGSVPDAVDLEEVADRLLDARCVALHALAVLKQEDVRAPWIEHYKFPMPRRLPKGGWQTVARDTPEATLEAIKKIFTVDDAWAYFIDSLNAGLEAFAPHMEYYATYAEEFGGTAYAEKIGTTGYGEIGRIPMPFGRPVPDLYSGLCGQVFNLLAEGLPVRGCANETCEQEFVRQRDRAEHGQYRTTGVLYCSRACARAQVKRVARRGARDRKNAQKRGSA
jgi:hypothetical protein